MRTRARTARRPCAGIAGSAARANRGILGQAGPRLLRHLPVRLGQSPSSLDALCKELQRVMSSAYDLKNQGEKFYVGPRCPKETLDRMGVSEPLQETPPAPPPAPEPQKAMPREEPAVVVDELKGSAVGWEELSDADFNVSDEVSVVTDLPTDPAGGIAAKTPGSAAGKTICHAVCQRDAPSASAACV